MRAPSITNALAALVDADTCPKCDRRRGGLTVNTMTAKQRGFRGEQLADVCRCESDAITPTPVVSPRPESAPTVAPSVTDAEVLASPSRRTFLR